MLNIKRYIFLNPQGVDCVCVKEKCLQYVILKKHDLAFLSKHLGIRDIFIGLGLNFHPQ